LEQRRPAAQRLISHTNQPPQHGHARFRSSSSSALGVAAAGALCWTGQCLELPGQPWRSMLEARWMDGLCISNDTANDTASSTGTHKDVSSPGSTGIHSPQCNRTWGGSGDTRTVAATIFPITPSLNSPNFPEFPIFHRVLGDLGCVFKLVHTPTRPPRTPMDGPECIRYAMMLPMMLHDAPSTDPWLPFAAAEHPSDTPSQPQHFYDFGNILGHLPNTSAPPPSPSPPRSPLASADADRSSLIQAPPNTKFPRIPCTMNKAYFSTPSHAISKRFGAHAQGRTKKDTSSTLTTTTCTPQFSIGMRPFLLNSFALVFQ